MEYKLRDYQVSLAEKALGILSVRKLVYLAIEVRVGKSLIAMETCKLFGAKKVLFVTKIKAFSSIKSDYDNFGYDFDLTIINKESIHKIESNDFDVIVCDEAHGLFGSFPKPNNFTKEFKRRFSSVPLIYLSGTPTPESYSQIFHQFWVSDNSPFYKYKNFYQWFNAMGFVKTEFDLGYGGMVANYTNNKEVIYKYYSLMKKNVSIHNVNYDSIIENINRAQSDSVQLCDKSNELLKEIIDLFTITYTQQEAGFETKVNEHVLYCDLKPETVKMMKSLISKRVIVGKEESIVADTAVKLQQKLHQLSGGTIKFEKRFCDRMEKQVCNSMVIDTSKAEFIKDHFSGKKIGIFYKFKEEYNALKIVFGDQLTDNLDEFNATSKNIALQVVSGREGISLKEADYLVFYAIDFSATSYFQARDRLSGIDRLNNDIYWIFSRGSIEERIYKSVVNKKSYTTSVFVKDYGIDK